MLRSQRISRGASRSYSGWATRLICAEMMNDSATVIASGVSHCGNTTLATIRPNSL